MFKPETKKELPLPEGSSLKKIFDTNIIPQKRGNKQMIEKVKKAYELLTELNNENGVINVHSGIQKVHMDDEAFFQTFSGCGVVERGCEEYPYEVFKVVDGLKFFTILSESDYKKFINHEKEAI